MPGIIEDWRVTGGPKPQNSTFRNTAMVGQGGAKWSRPPVEGEDPLFGSTVPYKIISHEKPWHRRAEELQLQGYSTAEIASMLGKAPSWVGQVLRQPFAQERMNARVKEDASAQIKAFLEEECLPSLVAIKEVRDSVSESVRTSDRLNAAQYLTDRFLGKATQPISSVDAKPAAELTNDELNAQVQSIVAGMATAPSDTQKPE